MTKDIEFKAVLIRDPKTAKSDNWQDTAHEWNVTINGQSFAYFTGLGHREHKGFGSEKYEYDRLKHRTLSDTGLKELLSMSRPTPPKLDDVLRSLVMDTEACEMPFGNWASNLGYDTDSREALETYLACQANTKKLLKAGIDLNAERERLKDY